MTEKTLTLTSDERWLVQEAMESEIEHCTRLEDLGGASEWDIERRRTARRVIEKLEAIR